MEQKESKSQAIANIKVIGVGGGGNNAIHSMIKENLQDVTFIAANTDQQVLNNSIAENIIVLGETAKGLGAGANPEIGKQSAEESQKEIAEYLQGADLVIVAAGMGGGTGTGAAPVIAEVAKQQGALTIGIVTTPFNFEGPSRMKNALAGIAELKKSVDSLIVVSNQKLLKQFGEISLKDSFMYADKTLKQAVRTITDLISTSALINLDFADVQTVMKNKGEAIIGIGQATGEDRAVRAAVHAISSPILEGSVRGATDAIINISGNDVTLEEADKAVQTITHLAGKDINIIFGVAINEKLEDNVQVSVIATGLDISAKSMTTETLREELVESIETLEVEFENENTKEILTSEPLPEDEKLTISDEVALINGDDDSSDDDEDLPSFLK